MTKKLFGEVAGTALLIYFGTGLGLFAAPADLVGASLGWGLVLALLVFMFGPLSGAHFNPVVSFAMLISKRMSFKEFLAYVAAQLVGGLLGELVVVMTYKDYLHHLGKSWSSMVSQNHLISTVFPNVSTGVAFFTEVLLTFVLVMTVLTITNKTTNSYGQFGPFIVGIIIFVLVLVGGNLTGASMNPVRSLFPALFAGGLALSQLWLYLIAPFVGSAIAVLVEKLVFPEQTNL
jgi:aquaporin Z